MAHQKHQRRSEKEWQEIIHHFQNSGLSGARFYRQQEIPYASFSKWRQRLSGINHDDIGMVTASSTSDFLDLSQLSSSQRNWRITLKLGNGVELELSQH